MTYSGESYIIRLTHTNYLLSFMSVLYTQTAKKHVRVTLTLDVLNDFEARNIDWRKVLKIEENEDCKCYIEDVDCQLDYYN